MQKLKLVLRLFWRFFVFGCFTFGGGWSIVAQMQKTFVEKEKSITTQELLDIVSVGRSLPGTMIGNVAMLYGYRCAGALGGAACVLGMILPPLLILTVITYFYSLFKSNTHVAAAMTGVRAAIVPIIFSAAYGMLKGAFKFPACYLMAAAAFALYFFLNVSCVLLVVIGLVFGLAVSEFYERRPPSGNGNDAA